MELFRDETLSFEERAADLCGRMTLPEKISWVGSWTSPIPRLGIPGWHFANEASHGINALNYVNDKGYNVTSFPTCLAMGQSWDTEKIKRVTEAISDEIRAAHNIGDETLSFWCPTINLSRDPRNGRSDENFGEDPYLSGKMAAAYIKGLQGAEADTKYKKTAATPKHFMLNSSENNRNTGISFADEKTIREYYARVFEYAFREGKAESVMISYNRINGHPAGADYFTMGTLLREEWGFDGYVTSDCGAVAQTYNAGTSAINQKPGCGHYYYNNLEEASAGTLKNGCDLSCGGEHRAHLMNAVEQGLITEDEIDRSVIRNLTSLFRQGIFDKKGSTPWDGLGADELNSKAHDDLAVDMANDTIVLLKNENNLLPIKKEGLEKVLVVGPNAKYRELGGYSCGGFGVGGPLDTKFNVMTLDGVKNELAGSGIEVAYEKGWCSEKERTKSLMEELQSIPGVDPEMVQRMMLETMGIEKHEESKTASDLPEYVPHTEPEDPDYRGDDEVIFARALDAAKDADLVIVVAGTDASTASEGKDRETIALPNGQSGRIAKLLEVNPNTVVVLTVMGTIGDPVLDQCPSLVLATHAGQSQGTAIANVLFGKVNPNGKLTATWYRDDSQLPEINDYGIRKADVLAQDHGRTYWYLDETPRFPFGYGLHYTTFAYSNMELCEEEIANGTNLKVSVDVTNTGNTAGKEIVELYVRKVVDETWGEKPGDNKPFRQLKGFEKIFLMPGETKTVTIEVPLKEITFWNYFRKKMRIEPSEYVAEVGASSADLPCSAHFTIKGEWEAPLVTVYAEADRYCYKAGETGKLRVVATREDTTRVDLCANPPKYFSSDETVASVDANGVIRALRSGTARITAEVTEGDHTVRRDVPVAVR